MRFLDWYLKIALVSAMIGGSMELFMIKTGFCGWAFLSYSSCSPASYSSIRASISSFQYLHLDILNLKLLCLIVNILHCCSCDMLLVDNFNFHIFFLVGTINLVQILICVSIWIRADDKVTVLESDKRAWENSPEAQAVREALNPWRDHDKQERKSS